MRTKVRVQEEVWRYVSPLPPRFVEGICLGAPAPSPFQHLRRPRPEQTFARRGAAPARGVWAGGGGGGAPSPVAEPPAAARCPPGGWRASNSWLLKIRGGPWLPHREGKESGKGWLAEPCAAAAPRKAGLGVYIKRGPARLSGRPAGAGPPPRARGARQRCPYPGCESLAGSPSSWAGRAHWGTS